VLAATSSTGAIYAGYDGLNSVYPGITVLDNNGGHYVYLNGTSMSSPHAAGVAALVKENHPTWGPGAIKAAVQRTAQHLDCPPVQLPGDPRHCYGDDGRTSFFGHGLVDAAAAAQE
jgi:subtilisin family serine protease